MESVTSWKIYLFVGVVIIRSPTSQGYSTFLVIVETENSPSIFTNHFDKQLKITIFNPPFLIFVVPTFVHACQTLQTHLPKKNVTVQ